MINFAANVEEIREVLEEGIDVECLGRNGTNF
jgi:hypothetical protein